MTLVLTAGSVSDTDPATDIVAAGATATINSATSANFGSAANPIQTSVDSLAVDTSTGGGSQFITEANELTALGLNAGTGDITLTLAAGALTDADSENDLIATATTVTLNNPTAKNVGASNSPVDVQADALAVQTSVGDGNQFFNLHRKLTALNLTAGTGSVEINSNFAIGDDDAATDISASSATITINLFIGQADRDVGSAANPLQLQLLSNLNVDTINGGGSQFLALSGGVLNLNLSSSTGNVTLVSNGASISDGDGNVDIAGNLAQITFSGAGNFGTAQFPIRTNLTTLSVDTSLGNGNQFLSDSSSVSVTNLDAGTGSITLTGGTFNLAGGGNNIGDQSTLTVNSPAVLNLNSNDEAIGGLAGSGNVAFKEETADHKLIVGLNNSNTTFSGNLSGNDVNGLGAVLDRFIKVGTGTLTLGGNNAFEGNYEVLNGKVLVTGTLNNDLTLTTVAGAGSAVAVLGGTGTINSRVTVGTGHLAPGTSTGGMTMRGLSFSEGSAFDVEITSASAGSFDQAKVLGAVNIATTGNGVALNLSKVGTLNLASGNRLVIVDNDGIDAVTGTFKDIVKVTGGFNVGSNFLGSGLTAKLLYDGGDGNDVSIELSPGSHFPWHNDTAGKANDVRGQNTAIPDGHVVADDALAIINFINANGAGAVPANAVLGLPFGFLDTTADNQIVAEDVLAVINFINAGLGGEGEAPMVEAEVAAPPASIPWAASPNSSADLLLLLATDLASQPAPRRRL